MTGCVLSPRFPPLSEIEKLEGNCDKENIPMPALPDRSALDRSDDKMAPVFGSNRVKEPPPPPGVTLDDGFVVVTLTMYFIFAFENFCRFFLLVAPAS
mmetsp:Transcript_5012/g.11961  ORF Transcript_5012/g.11961 Transcript_5012/m.11961 type:complete len:98 (+) Transcript_5012:2363-2656(+)